MTGKDDRKISSLRELAQDIAPARDLWPGIEARLTAEPRVASAGASPPRRVATLRLMGAAAVIAALAVGIWIGRNVTSFPGKPAGNGMTAGVTANEPAALPAAYLMDEKYMRQRAVLEKSLEEKVAALPPESRAKVMSSLATIHDSMRDLEAALGRDPSNALLQELLVNTYQDEMRVLTAVHEAGDAGKGI
ncbi:MAG: hypothetical protein ACREVV_01285 [Steroidobacteraceae bacterium]